MKQKTTILFDMYGVILLVSFIVICPLTLIKVSPISLQSRQTQMRESRQDRLYFLQAYQLL